MSQSLVVTDKRGVNVETLRVLHVAEIMIGGVATYIDELVREQILIYGKENVRLICPKCDIDNLSKEVRDAIEIVGFSRPRRGIIALMCLFKEFKKNRTIWEPSIVHAHSTFAGLVCRLPAFSALPRVVYTPHSWSFSMNVSPYLRAFYVWVERLLAKRTSAIAAVSQSELDLAFSNNIRARLMRVVYAGIRDRVLSCDVDERKNDRNSVTLIMVARFDYQKRQQDLVGALTHLKHLNWALRLVGEGIRRSEIEKLVADYGLQNRVAFLGLRDDVAELLESSDIFVMTSNYEGLPVSILEAMRASLPVIANDVDGNCEAVDDGETGYLIPLEDKNLLVERLRALISSKEQRTKFGQQALVRFKTFFLSSRMCEEMDDLYNSIGINN